MADDREVETMVCAVRLVRQYICAIRSDDGEPVHARL